MLQAIVIGAVLVFAILLDRLNRRYSPPILIGSLRRSAIRAENLSRAEHDAKPVIRYGTRAACKLG